MYLGAREQTASPEQFIDVNIQDLYLKTLAHYAEYYEEHTVAGNHLLHMTNPEECARLINQFIDRKAREAETDMSFFADFDSIAIK
jgi:hypothetical protein